MRFMIMGMATKETESGPPPTPEQFAAMQKYNAEAEIEIRKLMDVEDFGDGFTPNPDIAKVKNT